MDNSKDLEQNSLEADLELITEMLQTVAGRYEGNSLQLLRILRLLEKLHQDIRDDLFLAALPDNRQALYNLLRDMEAEGGWPYIQRMKLRGLINHSFLSFSQIQEEEPRDDLSRG